MLIDDATMQVSFLKDLVTLRAVLPIPSATAHRFAPTPPRPVWWHRTRQAWQHCATP